MEFILLYRGIEVIGILLGIDMESLEVSILELEKEPGLNIGEAGMGKTTMLKNVLQHLHTQKAGKSSNMSTR